MVHLHLSTEFDSLVKSEENLSTTEVELDLNCHRCIWYSCWADAQSAVVEVKVEAGAMVQVSVMVLDMKPHCVQLVAGVVVVTAVAAEAGMPVVTVTVGC